MVPLWGHPVEQNIDLPNEPFSNSEIDSDQSASNKELSIVRPKLRSNQTNGVWPKVKLRVKFLSVDDSSTWQRAVVVSKGGKNTGKYKNWLNIQLADDTQKAVDWEHDIIELEVINEEPETEEIINKEVATEESINIRPEIEDLNIKELVTEEVLLSQPWNEGKVDEAMDIELNNWRRNQVYEEVPYTRHNCISTS